MGTPVGRGRRAGVGRAATGEHARRPRPAPAEGRWLADRGDRDRPPSELGERMAGPCRRGQGRPTARQRASADRHRARPFSPATGAAWRADQAGSPLGGRTGGRAGAVAPRLAQPGALTESRPLPHTKRPVRRRGRRARSDRRARAVALAVSAQGPADRRPRRRGAATKRARRATGRVTTARTRRAAGPGAGVCRPITNTRSLSNPRAWRSRARRLSPWALGAPERRVRERGRRARSARASPRARSRRGQLGTHQQRAPAQRPS